MSTRGDYYLKLPNPARCGGLRWSHGCDAVEDVFGRTVVLFEELELILGGVLSARPVPPFVSVLQVLHHARCDIPRSAKFTLLRDATQRCKGEQLLARHLGRFIAELLSLLPPAPNPPTPDEAQVALYRLWSDGERRQSDHALLPELTEDEFTDRIGRRLEALSPSAIDHWLKFGTAPTEAGEKVADEVDELPVRVAATMELARTRPRLVGATVVAPVLEAALTLPPRGRTPDPLPQGGYADVTTRGDPDRLLLSQFALDPDDFVRRFAERELLYFKREEPHAAVPPERVVVLDQGVRTWGSVRLALAAAAATLLRRPAKSAPPSRMFVSGRNAELPLKTISPAALATALEASDTTPHPAGCLRSAFAGDDTGPRDVVLLTHPRAAAEAAVVVVAREARPTDRLFVLAVADDGGCQLTEWTSRGPVPVRGFRVDLAAAEAARPSAKVTVVPTGPGFGYRPWTGDVEPEFFPFRPGLVEPPAVFGFDADGEWLVAVGAGGVPHLMRTGGGAVEVLPRANFDGERLRTVTAVLPVTGGVVLCGTVAGAKGVAVVSVVSNPVAVGGAVDTVTPQHVVAHYDIASRAVRAFVVGLANGPAEWDSHLGLNCVVLRAGAAGVPLAVDLVNMNRLRPTEPTLKAEEAIRSPRRSAVGPTPLPVVTDLRTATDDQPVLGLRQNSFCLLQPGVGQWPWFEPREDGQPLLGGAIFRRVEFAGGVLALHIEKGGRHELRLFRGPDMTALGVLPLHGKRRLFRLSPDGKWVAWTRGKGDLAVVSTANPSVVVASAAQAGLHGRGNVHLWWQRFPTGEQVGGFLSVRVGGFRHEFKADGTSFAHQFTHTGKANQEPAAGDPSVAQQLRTTTGRCGEVVITDWLGTVLAMLLVRRDQAAGWTPAGGFWGHPALVGGAPTPGAEKALAAALGLVGKSS